MKKNKTKIKKYRAAEKYSIIADIVNHARLSLSYPHFEKKYLKRVDHNGNNNLLLETAPNTVAYVSFESLVGDILCYARNHLISTNDSLGLTHSEAVEAAKYAFKTMHRLKIEPLPFVIKSNSALAFNRLEFDPIENINLDKCPVWREVLNRMSNADSFCMWIAATLDPKADRKKVIYCWGERDSGKSQIQAVINRLAGSTAGNLGALDLQSNHWKSALLGKRIIFISEADSRFLESLVFKSITGDDVHNINPKGQPMFTAELPVMLFLVSNERPVFRNDEAIYARIIECEISPIAGDKLLPPIEYQQMLLNEIPDFLGYCVHLYEPYKGGKRIPSDTRNLREMSMESDREALDIFEQLFVQDPKEKVLRMDAITLVRSHMPGISSRRYGQMIDFWKSQFGIRESRISIRQPESSKDLRPHYLIGLRPRNDHERPAP